MTIVYFAVTHRLHCFPSTHTQAQDIDLKDEGYIRAMLVQIMPHKLDTYNCSNCSGLWRHQVISSNDVNYVKWACSWSLWERPTTFQRQGMAYNAICMYSSLSPGMRGFDLKCMMFIWVRSWNCGCLVTWFCYQLIAKPGNKTAAVSWPDPYALWWLLSWTLPVLLPVNKWHGTLLIISQGLVLLGTNHSHSVLS